MPVIACYFIGFRSVFYSTSYDFANLYYIVILLMLLPIIYYIFIWEISYSFPNFRDFSYFLLIFIFLAFWDIKSK